MLFVTAACKARDKKKKKSVIYLNNLCERARSIIATPGGIAAFCQVSPTVCQQHTMSIKNWQLQKWLEPD